MINFSRFVTQRHNASKAFSRVGLPQTYNYDDLVQCVKKIQLWLLV